MKFKLLALLVFSLVFSFTACENKKDEAITSAIGQEKITLHNLENITDKMATDTSISIENLNYFINALTRFGAENDSVIGKSVAEIIKMQKDFVKNGTVENLKNSGARINLFLNHKFQYVGIQINDSDKNNKINNLVFNIYNSSDKAIKRIEGRLLFYTPAGELVKLYSLVTATEIPVSEKDKPMQFSMPFKHDENSTRDKIIRESSNLRAVWTPTLVEFADGTKIEDRATKDDEFSGNNAKK